MMQPYFNKIADLDVASLRRCIDHMGDALWQFDQQRQRQFRVHANTQSVLLWYDKNRMLAEATIQPPYRILQRELAPLIDALSQRCIECYGHGNIARLLLVKLPAGGHIPEHSDIGAVFVKSHRLHIPIASHPKVIFTVAQESKFLAEGEVWEIDNCSSHSVINNSEIDRIHLIADWLATDG